MWYTVDTQRRSSDSSDDYVQIMATPDSTSSASCSRANDGIVRLNYNFKNYVQWKFLIKIALQEDENVWKVVTGETTNPVPDATGKFTPAQEEEFKTFSKNNKKAINIIGKSLDQDTLIRFIDEDMPFQSAARVWQSIVTVGTEMRTGIVQQTLSEIMNFRYDNRRSTDENFERFDKLNRALILSGEFLSENAQRAILLQSLPASWHAFQAAYTASGAANLDSLKQAITREAYRAKLAHARETSKVTAMFTKLSNNGKNSTAHDKTPQSKPLTHNPASGKTNRHAKWCEFCRKKGHTVSQCYKKNPALKPKRDYQAHDTEAINIEVFWANSGKPFSGPWTPAQHIQSLMI